MNKTTDVDNTGIYIKSSYEIADLNKIVIKFISSSFDIKTNEQIKPFQFKNFIGVFIGEIYNKKQLCKKYDLSTKTNIDIEIILNLFEKLGKSVIHHLDGFYSGFIYDKETQKLYFFRDYIGKKLLFLIKSQNTYFISSELKNLNSTEDFQIIPKGFSQLENNEIKLIEEHKIQSISKKLIKPTLVEVVKKMIPKNEKKFGVFLSGGLDSSIIASIVAKNATNVTYYTLGNKDDLKFVNLLAKKLKIESKIKQVSLPTQQELPQFIEKVVYHLESYNPSIISNGLAAYLLAYEASKDGLKIVLTGEGADELFCGYTISSDANVRFDKRTQLIENIEFTECRRLDMASMAHLIEARCPFLDKKIYSVANDCTAKDLTSNNQGKKILRNAFKTDLPNEIAERIKTSFDVGSGIRGLVVKYLTQNNVEEKNSLKKIWSKYFPESISDNFYFHKYPIFDKYIVKRGVLHHINQMEKIEKLLWQEFCQVPFHNIFLLNSKNIVSKNLGGTCSDKSLHFKKVLSEHGINSKLHSAYINNVECHRMLSVQINNKTYFIDPGSGWLNPKLIPSFDSIEYSVFGISYKTKILDDRVLLLHKVDGKNSDFKLMIDIPFKSKSEKEIVVDIENRFSLNIEYPFKNSLRFSQVLDDSFYFLRGDILNIYSDKGIEERVFDKFEIKRFLKDTFKFKLEGFKKYYTPAIDISVLIATQNNNEVLKLNLENIFAQSLQPNRIIVVDNSDNQIELNKNAELVRKYVKKTQNTCILYSVNSRTKNKSGSFNTGIDLLLLQNVNIENTFLVLMSENECYLPKFIESSAIEIRKNNLDMIACDFYKNINKEKNKILAPEKLNSADFLNHNFILDSFNIFVRLSCFLEAGCFDENLTAYEMGDFFIKIADLGNVKYKRLASTLVNNNSQNKILSNTKKNSINLGIYHFWLKYSKRMKKMQQKSYLKNANTFFDWQLSKHFIKKLQTQIIETKDSNNIESYEKIDLLVGVICSEYKIISPLLFQLAELQKQNFIDKVQVHIFENNLSACDKNKLILQTKEIDCYFITKQMQDEWIKKVDYFKSFSRNKNNMFSIAQARSLFQKYIGQVMQQNPNFIVWLLDEDMQITKNTTEGLKCLIQLKKQGIDILLGKFEHSSPNPPINGARAQLVDFWHNLNWLLNQNPKSILEDISYENNLLIEKYPDYYYDLSRKHSAHLEFPFWIKPKYPTQTVEEAIDDLCKNAILIFGGTPLTRPLITIYSKRIVDSVKDSVNRGGNTIVFNAKALNNVPNLNININGTDIRRSDMVWAIINKYYLKMNIKAVDISIWHSGKDVQNINALDLNKVREEILGSCLYAALTNFLATNPDHCLEFSDNEIIKILELFEKHIKKRLILLRQSFYRARGIANSLESLKFYKKNSNLQTLTEVIKKQFNAENFKWIEENVDVLTFDGLSECLKSIQKKSNSFKESKYYEFK